MDMLDIEKVKEELSERGWAVLPDVIPEAVCDEYAGELQEWASSFGTKFPTNWESIVHEYGVAHLEAAWKVRLDCKSVFSRLWETEKLLTSFDGLAIGGPPEESTGYFSGKRPSSLHLDQERRKLGVHAYQGGVYLEEAREDDWCFSVIDKSHLHHHEFMEHFKIPPAYHPADEFLPLDEYWVKWYRELGCEVIRIPVPKGGMVLWDSRTVHAGAPPIEGRANPGRWRYVVFVCMVPAAWATEESLKAKRDAYDNIRTTCHWPARGCRYFERYLKNRSQDVTALPECAKTDEAKQLAGILKYENEDGKPNGPPLPKYDESEYIL